MMTIYFWILSLYLLLCSSISPESEVEYLKNSEKVHGNALDKALESHFAFYYSLHAQERVTSTWSSPLASKAHQIASKCVDFQTPTTLPRSLHMTQSYVNSEGIPRVILDSMVRRKWASFIGAHYSVGKSAEPGFNGHHSVKQSGGIFVGCGTAPCSSRVSTIVCLYRQNIRDPAKRTTPRINGRVANKRPKRQIGPPAPAPVPSTISEPVGAPASVPTTTIESPIAPAPVPTTTIESPIAPAPDPTTTIEPPIAPAPVPTTTIEPPIAPAPVPTTTIEPAIAPAPIPTTTIESPIAPAPVPTTTIEPPIAPAPFPTTTVEPPIAPAPVLATTIEPPIAPVPVPTTTTEQQTTNCNCANGGTLTEVMPSCICACVVEWQGDICDENVEEAQSGVRINVATTLDQWDIVWTRIQYFTALEVNEHCVNDVTSCCPDASISQAAADITFMSNEDVQLGTGFPKEEQHGGTYLAAVFYAHGSDNNQLCDASARRKRALHEYTLPQDLLYTLVSAASSDISNAIQACCGATILSVEIPSAPDNAIDTTDDPRNSEVTIDNGLVTDTEIQSAELSTSDDVAYTTAASVEGQSSKEKSDNSVGIPDWAWVIVGTAAALLFGLVTLCCLKRLRPYLETKPLSLPTTYKVFKGETKEKITDDKSNQPPQPKPRSSIRATKPPQPKPRLSIRKNQGSKENIEKIDTKDLRNELTRDRSKVSSARSSSRSLGYVDLHMAKTSRDTSSINSDERLQIQHKNSDSVYSELPGVHHSQHNSPVGGYFEMTNDMTDAYQRKRRSSNRGSRKSKDHEFRERSNTSDNIDHSQSKYRSGLSNLGARMQSRAGELLFDSQRRDTYDTHQSDRYKGRVPEPDADYPPSSKLGSRMRERAAQLLYGEEPANIYDYRGDVSARYQSTQQRTSRTKDVAYPTTHHSNVQTSHSSLHSELQDYFKGTRNKSDRASDTRLETRRRPHATNDVVQGTHLSRTYSDNHIERTYSGSHWHHHRTNSEIDLRMFDQTKRKRLPRSSSESSSPGDNKMNTNIASATRSFSLNQRRRHHSESSGSSYPENKSRGRGDDDNQQRSRRGFHQFQRSMSSRNLHGSHSRKRKRSRSLSKPRRSISLRRQASDASGDSRQSDSEVEESFRDSKGDLAQSFDDFGQSYALSRKSNWFPNRLLANSDLDLNRYESD